MEIMTHVPGTIVELAVSGMTCTGCSSSIEQALTALPGVRSASVDHTTGRAVVLLVGGVSAEDFAFDADAAIHDAGYTLESAAARPERAGGGGCGGGGACGCGGAEAKAPEPVQAVASEGDGCCGGGGCC
ncbi:heavy metal-associated domain-containing protein [Demequina sp. SYSU T00039]|uniref:Heavy metal-associated domain-containing protein n=1 Tax=Demequina lignilytica TaxID=3051663 RepID=A0AAW7M8C9_9MICO|nr:MULTISPECIES: heavy metal-associated domain-containing protein [unclassified Demequina]MDN4477791.1 heavy metal-associated domain-containing protein [Demequina sp. SYSU T00039-1]MDN4487700.1 heavy metal-associated domain-containing protein [Demequina sp. SYSU T00039]MDN4491411.1 heavy metal-associated domain-containing protein [Demequina sp. SYSU T00068]